jgi:hypothetical protein
MERQQFWPLFVTTAVFVSQQLLQLADKVAATLSSGVRTVVHTESCIYSCVTADLSRYTDTDRN